MYHSMRQIHHHSHQYSHGDKQHILLEIYISWSFIDDLSQDSEPMMISRVRVKIRFMNDAIEY